MPQCAVIGWPGQIGQASPAALSQTVKTKSISGAPGAANSSQLFERKPAVSKSGSSAVERVADGPRPWAGCRPSRRGSGRSPTRLRMRLGDDRAGRIAGAQEQDIVGSDRSLPQRPARLAAHDGRPRRARRAALGRQVSGAPAQQLSVRNAIRPFMPFVVGGIDHRAAVAADGHQARRDAARQMERQRVGRRSVETLGDLARRQAVGAGSGPTGGTRRGGCPGRARRGPLRRLPFPMIP